MPDTVLPEVSFAFSSSAAPAASWLVAQFHLHEELSSIYECTVDLAEEGRTDLETLLEMPAAFLIKRGELTRRVRGIVRAAEDFGTTPTRRHLRVHLVPSLWLLSQRKDSRIFQDLAGVEVVKEVLKAAGIYQGDGQLDDKDVTVADYPKRECCVQYRETDLAFVTRLLEEEGITYYFRHTESGEVLVLAADAAADPFQTVAPTLNGLPVPITGSGGLTHEVETVRSLEMSARLQPTGVTLRDWDFTHPFDPAASSPGRESVMTQSNPSDVKNRSIYDYPAGALSDYDEGAHYYKKNDLTRRAMVQYTGYDGQRSRGRGAGVVSGFMPGLRTSLITEDWNLIGPFVLTGVEHFGRNAQDPNDTNPLTDEDRYSNTFDLMPAKKIFRAPHRTPRPIVHGPQTATVMAKPGSTEEICVDYYGRILVRFHWERPETRSDSQRNKYSSCWVRVAQAWAGGGWGVMFNPRVGMEVVVQFLEGDPDRPLVTGCVYNLLNLPPPQEELEAKRTRSTIRTNSSPGGNGFNELYFEDLAGKEQVYLHAQRDLDEVVLHNHTEKVKCNESISVGGDQSVFVGGNQTVTVKKDQTTHIEGGQEYKVKQNQFITVTGLQETVVEEYCNVWVTGEYMLYVKSDAGFYATGHTMMHQAKLVHLLGDEEVMIEGKKKITLKVGGSSIEITDGKVAINSGKGAKVEVDGAKVNVDGTSEVDIHGAQVKINADIMVDVKGALIKLNS